MQKYPQVNVRVDSDFLKRIDEWRRGQSDLPARPEAIRRLVEAVLGKKPNARTLQTLKETAKKG